MNSFFVFIYICELNSGHWPNQYPSPNPNLFLTLTLVHILISALTHVAAKYFKNKQINKNQVKKIKRKK